MIGEITNHIWQSTVFAAAAALLALAFRKNRAEVRYWLWLSASLKFLVPFSLLISCGTLLWDTLPAGKIPDQIAAPAVSQTMVQITQPFPETFAYASSARHATNWFLIALVTAWAIGFLAIAVMRFRGWLRIRAAVRASTLINIAATVPVRSSATLLEPGVVGFLRPILLLPEGILKALTPPQLEAVLAHEQSHIRRRDNLTSALHMIVEALFWFHPIVWWIGAKLVEERERACDESVLAHGSEPQVYAEGILNVCRSYLESPLRCVSGITGSDLKKRIRAILTGVGGDNLTLSRRLLLTIFGVAAIALPVAFGLVIAPLRQSSSQAAGKVSFDVASIRERKPGQPLVGDIGIQFSSGSLTAQCVTLRSLLSYAFHLTRAVPILGLPKWASAPCGDYSTADTYAFEATMPLATTDEQARQMMQTLLADRFNLVTHWEKKEMPIFALVISPDGFKLKPSDPKNDAPIPPHSMGCPREDPGCHLMGGTGPISVLAGMLSPPAGRSVIDKTGLTAEYNFNLKWAGDTATDSPLPSLPTALRETFGLELKRQVGPVDAIFIDHAEKPSGN